MISEVKLGERCDQHLLQGESKVGGLALQHLSTRMHVVWLLGHDNPPLRRAFKRVRVPEANAGCVNVGHLFFKLII